LAIGLDGFKGDKDVLIIARESGALKKPPASTIKSSSKKKVA